MLLTYSHFWKRQNSEKDIPFTKDNSSESEGLTKRTLDLSGEVMLGFKW